MVKITIKRESLLKPLQLVAGVVERRQTLPILSHILVTLQDKDLTFIGTDLEVELCGLTHMEQAIEKPAEVTLPGKKFLDICRALPENSLLELTEDHARITVSSGKSRFVLSSLPTRDFPRTPVQEKALEFGITQGALRKLIEKTSFAIPQQDVRQYLNGLLIEVKDGLIQALATDGHRLAMNSISSSVVDNSFAQVIIPRKGVVELLRLLESSDEEVTMSFNNNFVRVKGDNFILTSKLISGKFPNYNKIIPKRGDKRVEINCNELKQALNRVGILSNELFRSARFQLHSNTLVLTTNNPDQEEAAEELVVDYQGESLNAIFNISYFVDILSIIETEKISISFKDGESGVVIEEVSGSTNCLYVLMPIRQ
ncbi:MAG: DNA polymerase III subunit beta [bacterium]